MTDSFSYQWNKFKYLQFESENVGKPMQGHTMNMFLKICQVKTLKGKVVLDIGCGPGRFLEVSKMLGAAFIIGIDQNTRQAEEFFGITGEKEWVNGVVVVEGDINNMMNSNIKKYSFDCIYSIGVLHHIENPQMAILHAYELLKPNGWLALAVYQKGYYNCIQVRAWRKIFKVLGLRAAYAYSWFMGMVVNFVCRRIPYSSKVINLVFPFVSLPDDRWSVLDTFDSLTPKIQNTYEPIDVQRWLQHAGFDYIRHTDWGRTSFKAFKPII